jgi:2',3'-cyclic-nucleotide 2'-phosphodiesterase (5'-nucleotidase family)
MMWGRAAAAVLGALVAAGCGDDDTDGDDDDRAAVDASAQAVDASVGAADASGSDASAEVGDGGLDAPDGSDVATDGGDTTPDAAVMAACACAPTSCDEALGGAALGEVTVDLDLDERAVRGRETPVGNLVADAYRWYAAEQGSPVDVAIVNAGSLRCGGGVGGDCDGYCLTSGAVTQAEIDALLWFDGSIAIAELSCIQLRSTLERSVSGLPETLGGWFLQVSGASFAADCTAQRQLLELEGLGIAVEGERVGELLVGGAPCDPSRSYRVATNTFVAGGGDAHYALPAVPATETGWRERDVVATYLAAMSPLTPTAGGRIDLASSCCTSCD